MSIQAELLARVRSRDAVVGVVGLGYVGLPLAVAFGEAGFKVLGFDVNDRVTGLINSGDSHVSDVAAERVRSLLDQGLFEASADFDRLREADSIIICVPTPLSKTDDPDLSYVLQATDEVKRRLRKGQLVVLESTTYPGTTREIVQSKLEETGLRAGEEFFVAFSPERVDPGNPTWQIENTPKVVGGLTESCHEVTMALYEQAIQTVVGVTSPEVAELAKLLENTFRAVNIGLVNEMAMIADRLGIDVWEVIDAAATKPYGFMSFFPGPGLGGHCIPIDPLFLAWKMKTLQYRTRFIELAAEVNAEMPRYVVERVAEALNESRKAVNGSRILVIGVSYKPDVDDTRESPAMDIIGLLQERGARVDYHDPHVPKLELESGTLTSVPLSSAELEAADLVVIATDHASLDYDLISRESDIIVDPRNAISDPGASTVYPIAGPPRRNGT